MNVFGPMHAAHECEFNIGGAAGPGDEDEVAGVVGDVWMRGEEGCHIGIKIAHAQQGDVRERRE